jgi:hypothetical protein
VSRGGTEGRERAKDENGNNEEVKEISSLISSLPR